MAAVILKDLTLGYDRHPAVHHVSGAFEKGSLTAITGPNGAGKSTLLKGIAGLVAPDDGEIIFEGITRKDIAYLPQGTELQTDFPVSVLQMVSTGFWNRTGGFGAFDPLYREKALAALDSVGLHDFTHRQIGSLSTGQLQRALFARLLLQDAQLILLDEPFSALDSETIERLLLVIRQWHDEGRTIICVLHDPEQIRRYFPDCLLLARDCVAWGKTAQTLTPDKLQQARHFHEAWRMEPEVCER